jgi:DNA-binding PadR family transcriptional regulator
MLELAILGLLDENDLHGYELRKRLGDLVGLRLAISFGSLYPALSRLERHGLVEVVAARPVAAPPRSPMSGSLAGELAAFGAQRRAVAAGARGARGKKVYGITDAGRRRLAELVSTPTCPTTAPSRCGWRSAACWLPPTASPCSSGAAPSSPSGPASVAGCRRTGA